MQAWVRLQGLKVRDLFEGRDAAGKGGVSKRITEPLSPRVCRVVALDTPLRTRTITVAFSAIRADESASASTPRRCFPS